MGREPGLFVGCCVSELCSVLLCAEYFWPRLTDVPTIGCPVARVGATLKGRSSDLSQVLKNICTYSCATCLILLNSMGC